MNIIVAYVDDGIRFDEMDLGFQLCSLSCFVRIIVIGIIIFLGEDLGVFEE